MRSLHKPSDNLDQSPLYRFQTGEWSRTDLLDPLVVACDDATYCTFTGAKTGTQGAAYLSGTLTMRKGEVTLVVQADEAANQANKVAGRPFHEADHWPNPRFRACRPPSRREPVCDVLTHRTEA